MSINIWIQHLKLRTRLKLRLATIKVLILKGLADFFFWEIGAIYSDIALCILNERLLKNVGFFDLGSAVLMQGIQFWRSFLQEYRRTKEEANKKTRHYYLWNSTPHTMTTSKYFFHFKQQIANFPVASSITVSPKLKISLILT